MINDGEDLRDPIPKRRQNTASEMDQDVMDIVKGRDLRNRYKGIKQLERTLRSRLNGDEDKVLKYATKEIKSRIISHEKTK